MENKKLYKIIISVGVLSFYLFPVFFFLTFIKLIILITQILVMNRFLFSLNLVQGLNNLQQQIIPFLKDSTTFLDAAYKTQYVFNIKAGKYEIKKGFSNKEIINSLRFKNIPVKVTFNNMERIENLASRVSKFIEADSLSLMNSFNKKTFLESNDLDTESVFSIFLPNTYEFYWNTSADQFRDKMLDQFKLFWNPSRIKKAKSYNLNPIEVSILASIVQRETPKVDERPTISGVYYNRLRRKMKLTGRSNNCIYN
jgi:UPF0755 protein